MPHLILSVSAELAEHSTVLLQAGHQAMLDSELTLNPDVKSRVQVWKETRVGDNNEDAFIHAEVRLLQKPERTNEAQKRLADAIVAALQEAWTNHPQQQSVQISCETVLMNSATYSKQRVEI